MRTDDNWFTTPPHPPESVMADEDEDKMNETEPSWADIVLEQAIEETMLARAERKHER